MGQGPKGVRRIDGESPFDQSVRSKRIKRIQWILIHFALTDNGIVICLKCCILETGSKRLMSNL